MHARLFASSILLAFALPASAAPPVLSYDRPGLAAAAREVPLRGPLTLADVPLAAGERVTLELERFAVFAPDAVVEIHGDAGVTRLAPPDNAYFRGRVAGRPGSTALLSALESGEVRGLVLDGPRIFQLGADPQDASRRTSREVDPEEPRAPFTCGTAELETDDLLAALRARSDAAAVRRPQPDVRASYTARMAIETDYEFYAKFAATTGVVGAINYVGDLLGYSSTFYDREIDTTLLVSYVSLWTTASDPWVQTSTHCGFYEFGNYWNLNRTGVSRTLAHFLSGKSTGGGVAWVGVLCRGPITATGVSCSGLNTSGSYGGAYAFSGSLQANFNLSSPSPVWDLFEVSHETGHNFASPHTHCYKNIGGNADPVDRCYNQQTGASCASAADGAQALPGVGSLTGGTAGAGNGTIMSYCHLLGGSYPNIALTFGQGHAYGIAPSRVVTVMHDHVVATASGNPSCLAFTPPVKGDFDGDRQTDLVLLETATGAARYWLMNGVTRASELPVSPATPASGYRLAATDDFNGDQRTDLVFQNLATTGAEFWFMRNNARIGSAVAATGAPPPGANWYLAAAADFNADGWPDILWRNTSTQKLSIWTMNGTARLGTLTPVPDQAVDGNWAVVAALDYDKDGDTDLLWYNSTSGKIVLWWMNASVQRVTGGFTTPTNAGDNNWKVVASGDYGVGAGGTAGTNDIVWRNDTSGKLVVWYMNTAGVRTDGVFTSPDSPSPALSFTVAGPR
jgi:hypothetical protein